MILYTLPTADLLNVYFFVQWGIKPKLRLSSVHFISSSPVFHQEQLLEEKSFFFFVTVNDKSLLK